MVEMRCGSEKGSSEPFFPSLSKLNVVIYCDLSMFLFDIFSPLVSQFRTCVRAYMRVRRMRFIVERNFHCKAATEAWISSVIRSKVNRLCGGSIARTSSFASLVQSLNGLHRSRIPCCALVLFIMFARSLARWWIIKQLKRKYSIHG